MALSPCLKVQPGLQFLVQNSQNVEPVVWAVPRSDFREAVRWAGKPSVSSTDSGTLKSAPQHRDAPAICITVNASANTTKHIVSHLNRGLLRDVLYSLPVVRLLARESVIAL
jgi:hypothetical protein